MRIPRKAEGNLKNANHTTGEPIFIVVILINHLGAFFLCAQVLSVSLSRACLYRRIIINGNKKKQNKTAPKKTKTNKQKYKL